MKSFKLLFLFLAFVLLFQNVKAIDPPPTVNVGCVVDPLSITATSFTFDVFIQRTGTVPFDYVKGQYCFSYNTAIRPGGTGGTWTVTILNSDLPTTKRSIVTSVTTSTNGVFYLVAPSDNTDPFDISNTTPVLVARVQATLSVPFTVNPLNLVWRFASPNPFTKIYYNDHAVLEASVVIPPGNLTFPPVVNGGALVPVELSSFSAAAQGRDVNLNWETKTEINSFSFEVEKQAVANNKTGDWKTIGSVPSAGNSNSPKQYSFTDKKLNSGKFNYRLKMIDNNGTFKYSNLVEAEIELPKDYAISQNYPNPFNPTSRIDYQLPFDSKVTLELYGITGERIASLINSDLSAGYYTADINASALNLASGVYIYRIVAQNPTGQNFVQVKKLMLMK